jgi:antitoxin component YwqK of YwqJK toxin-antitoxin module
MFSLFVSSIVLVPNKLGSDLKTATNNYDKNGKKVGKWYYFGKDIPQANYPDEALVMEGQYIAGKREGTWKKYHKDGKTISFIGDYHNNRPNGSFSKFNNNGSLVESGSFSDGKYEGTLAKYYDNGIIMYKGEFFQGVENGEIKYYNEIGKVELAYNSYEGTISNEITRNEVQNNEKLKGLNNPKTINKSIAENNLAPLISNPIVKNGVFNPNGYNKVYNDKNDILQDGVFKEGRLLDGKVYQYDTDGILFKVKVYKNGTYISDGQI